MEERKLVCYIVDFGEHYKPFVASVHESEGDNDSFLDIIARGSKTSKLEDAQKFVNDNAPGNAKKYLNPINKNNSGITWLSELENTN